MPNTYLFHLGSHPALSVAELAAVLAAQVPAVHLQAGGPTFLTASLPTPLLTGFISRLGGIQRIVLVTGTWTHQPTAEEIVAALPLSKDEKMTVGFSALDWPGDLKKMAGEIKRAARLGRVRMAYVLPAGRARQLNAGHIIGYNLLTLPQAEVVIAKGSAGQHYIGLTQAVQDVVGYEKRDAARPVRDATTGMVPIKLAQILLNVAAPKAPATIWDPFCGMGTILQEGWMFGHSMIGSDKEARMVAAAQQNLEWLKTSAALQSVIPRVFQHDVSNGADIAEESLDAIVTEPTLGPPLTAPLPQAERQKIEGQLTGLYAAAFKNFHTRLRMGGRVVFILPAWRQSRRGGPLTPLSPTFLDEIRSFGYRLLHLLPENLQSVYRETDRGTLVYQRPDALVGREITLWEKTG